MFAFSLSQFQESRVVYFLLTFLVLCNDMKCFQRRSCHRQGNKQRSIGIKSFYSNTSYGFEYKRNCISKLFVKMFIKRKTRTEKVYPYRMLLSFKTSVAHIFFNFTSDNCVRSQTAFVGHNSTSDIVRCLGANIQA